MQNQFHPYQFHKGWINQYYLKLSQFLSIAFGVVKTRFRILWVPLLSQIVVYSTLYYFYFQNVEDWVLNLQYGIQYNYALSTIFMICLFFVYLAVLVYSFGIILVQTRAYIDDQYIDLSESLKIVTQRLGGLITSGLSKFLIYFGIFLAFFLVAFAIILVTVGVNIDAMSDWSFEYGMSRIFVYMIVLMVVYSGVMVLVVYVNLRLLFSSHFALNYQCGGFKALKYSDLLTKGQKGKLFGYTMFFVGISLVISMFVGLFSSIFYLNDFTYDSLNMISSYGFYDTYWGSMITSIITIPLSIFQMIFFSGVFYNLDRIQKRYQLNPDPVLNNLQDSFTGFVDQKSEIR